MDILILYAQKTSIDRKTIDDHLYSFSRYVEGHRFYYLNAVESNSINKEVLRIPFDAVILHYTFLAQRYDPVIWKKQYPRFKKMIAALKGYKVMLPQDDYNYTADLWRIARDCGINHISSIIPKDQLAVAYPPEQIGCITTETVLTGYIDEDSLAKIEALQANYVRSIDIGYRARKMPYWIGHHGMLKAQLTEVFKNALSSAPELVTDINNTDADGCLKAYLGDDWIRFLLSCRCMLGCLGGSSILDPYGEVAKRTADYCAAHPEAEYEEVKAACFANEEDSIQAFMLSPRVFECAMTKTCQLLVEGDYYGILKPDVDYIEIKRDFSNLDEVLNKVRDHAYCDKIAQQCYDHVVRPGDPNNPYTYRAFANHVIAYIETHRRHTAKKTRVTALQNAYLLKHCGYYSSEEYFKTLFKAPPPPRKQRLRSSCRYHLWYENQFLVLWKLVRYIWTKEGREKIRDGFARRLGKSGDAASR